jgi:3'-phosphoadenosine 5'-phosphosulfate sulfotransferase (PAPS reductase)/FAD synthetase
LKKEGICKIKPILWWTESEVWDFIHKENLPINPIYSRGADRVGCMPCTAHKFWKSQLAKTNPKLFKRIMLLKEKQYIMSEVFQGEDEAAQVLGLVR